MRKLVTVRTLSELHPIKGADFIEMGIIDGWQVIVKKGEFEEGDLCVFFEIDSFLPVDPRYEFLGKTQEHQGKLGYRLKTLKLKKTLSQGLALPLNMFPEISNKDWGNDVTDKLKVFKYDNTTTLRGAANNPPNKKFRNFPEFLRKTDQERIQNLMSYFDTQEDTPFEETLKLDGSSCTMYSHKTNYTLYERFKNLFTGEFRSTYTRFGVASRNLDLKRGVSKSTTFTNGEQTSEFSTSNFWKAAIKYNIEDMLPEGYAIQGELIGPKIQSNHEKVEDIEFYIFDVFNIKTQKYLTPAERVQFLLDNGMLHIHIPIVNSEVYLFTEHTNINTLLERVAGDSMNRGVVSEGRVYKSHDGKRTFKVINNKFLLKYEQ